MSVRQQLLDETLLALAEEPVDEIALLGRTADALWLEAQLRQVGPWDVTVHQKDSFGALASVGLLVVCDDAGKEELLRQAAQTTGTPPPRVVLAGTAHLEFADPVFAELEAPALVPSYATGHAHTRVHLYQCLKTAAAVGRRGAIVEFGAFKGGTTVWLAETARALGLEDCPVFGFDSWSGFPPRRSLLDLYEHPRCVFTDQAAVAAYCEPYGIELIAGDISETAHALGERPVLLAFLDTDNYSPALAALEVVREQVVEGGAIVFDHFTTTADYVRTVGERMAAREMLSDDRFFHLHGTGVFLKLS
jgi:O-methyltransferase